MFVLSCVCLVLCFVVSQLVPYIGTFLPKKHSADKKYDIVKEKNGCLISQIAWRRTKLINQVDTISRIISACPEGYFYAGEPKYKETRGEFWEKGPTSPVYSCYRFNRVKISKN